MNVFLTQRRTLRQKQQQLEELVFSSWFKAIVIAVIVVFGALFIYQTNVIAEKGYALSDLEVQIRDLERENRKLDVAIAEQGSIKNIAERVAGLGMVPVSDVEYVSVLEGEVALK